VLQEACAPVAQTTGASLPAAAVYKPGPCGDVLPGEAERMAGRQAANPVNPMKREIAMPGTLQTRSSRNSNSS